MSSTSLQIVFEGPAVESGTIDARVLAESLSGYSEVFTRANVMLNGEASEAAVLVESDFKKGSFVAGLQFVQNVAVQAQHLITAHPFLDATGLAGLIGFVYREAVKESLIELYKWLKGKKPDRTVQVEGNNVEVTLGDSKKIVNNFTFNLSNDPAIRSGLARITSPLRQAGIDRISVQQEGAEQTAIEKSEAEYFEPAPLDSESDETALEGQRRAVLTVSKLSFTEGSTWTFLERGAIVVAKIEDDEFWQKVHEHKVTFGEGDQLRVHLNWATVRKRTKLTAKNTIVKVLEVLVRPRQMRLDGKKDDDVIPDSLRKIRKD